MFKEALGIAGDVVGLASGISGLFGRGGGGGIGADFYWKQLELQENLAKNGIQWRVEDAKKAGIHPLYAIGAPPMSAAPIQGFVDGGDDFMSRFATHGQDISRALKATASNTTRVENRINALALERAELQNDLLRSQIAREKAQIGPPMPTALGMEPMVEGLQIGVGPASPPVKDKPMERTQTDPARRHQEPAAIPDTGFVNTGTGLAPVPSKDVKERIEDMNLNELMWMFRNNLLPTIGMGDPPPQHMLPEGAIRWKWNGWRQEWQPEYLGKGTKLKGRE